MTTALDHFAREMRETGLVRRLLELARDEDLGLAGDITSLATVPAHAQGRVALNAREPAILAGLAFAPDVLELFAPHCLFRPLARDGDRLTAGQAVASLAGPLRQLLAAERTLLNLVCRLSGIATRTAEFIAAMGDAKAQLCDTRKTTPGLRVLEKYAVRCGGGQSHRLGLHDAILIKDNHIASVTLDRLASVVAEAAASARGRFSPKFIQVEVDHLDQLDRLLTLPKGTIDIVLLDNMPPEMLREAVRRRDEHRPGLLLEASGGVTLRTIAAIAATGVDRVSVGSLTHGATSIDFGLDALPDTPP
jgi:nicotinate-nucleotide pyrophosphorylase (carboxylating)